jgi:hypothetical protein
MSPHSVAGQGLEAPGALAICGKSRRCSREVGGQTPVFGLRVRPNRGALPVCPPVASLRGGCALPIEAPSGPPSGTLGRMRQVRARYENGALLPAKPLPLKQGEDVSIVVLRQADEARWNLERLGACQFAGSWGQPFAGTWGQGGERNDFTESAASLVRCPSPSRTCSGRRCFAGGWGQCQRDRARARGCARVFMAGDAGGGLAASSVGLSLGR